MILQKQTKEKYKSDALSRKQLSDFFNDYEKEEKEYDTLWDNWFLSESIHCHQDYGGEYAGSGTLDYIEGLILYTLVRKNKPKIVFEIGTAQGMSAALMASAIEANQNSGKIFCVDIKLPHRMSPTFSKAMENDIIEFYEADVFEFLGVIPEIPDFVFVDADHREEFCMKITKTLVNSFPNAIYGIATSLWNGNSNTLTTLVLNSTISTSQFTLYQPDSSNSGRVGSYIVTGR